MNPLPLILGAALGVGVLLCWYGFRRMTNRELADMERRKGLWCLNGGLVLVAGSAAVFSYAGR